MLSTLVIYGAKICVYIYGPNIINHPHPLSLGIIKASVCFQNVVIVDLRINRKALSSKHLQSVDLTIWALSVTNSSTVKCW